MINILNLKSNIIIYKVIHRYIYICFFCIIITMYNKCLHLRYVSSSVSVKSDLSKGGMPNFSEKKTSSIKRYFMCFTL